jgi:hypothetical protein
VITPSDFVRLLLDPVRLAVAGDAVEGASSLSDLASRLGVDERVVAEARGKLIAAGLIENDGINRDLLRAVAQELPSAPPAADSVIDGPWTTEEAEVLRRFFTGGRLDSIPTNLTKRRVILERLAQEFEPGLRYEEADVNFRLQLFYADYAALRRYLVDEGMMSRAEGVYWRTGGRYQNESGHASAEAAASDDA